MKLAFLLVFAFALTSVVNSHQLGVRLQDIQELTFRKDIWTKNVRDPTTTQLVFVGGNARRNISQVKYVKCLNTSDNWNCTVNNLDPVFNFTMTTINCEGASYQYDEYILPESCYLEYELNYMSVIQLGNVTKSTNSVNVTDSYMYYDFTCWLFNDFTDNPDIKQDILFGSVASFVVVLLVCNCCNCNNKKRQVIDNAEEASESDGDENEE